MPPFEQTSLWTPPPSTAYQTPTPSMQDIVVAEYCMTTMTIAGPLTTWTTIRSMPICTWTSGSPAATSSNAVPYPDIPPTFPKKYWIPLVIVCSLIVLLGLMFALCCGCYGRRNRDKSSGGSLRVTEVTSRGYDKSKNDKSQENGKVDKKAVGKEGEKQKIAKGGKTTPADEEFHNKRDEREAQLKKAAEELQAKRDEREALLKQAAAEARERADRLAQSVRNQTWNQR